MVIGDVNVTYVIDTCYTQPMLPVESTLNFIHSGNCCEPWMHS